MWLETEIELIKTEQVDLGIEPEKVYVKAYLDLSKITFLREVILEKESDKPATDMCCVTLLDAQEYIIKVPYNSIKDLISHGLNI